MCRNDRLIDDEVDVVCGFKQLTELTSTKTLEAVAAVVVREWVGHSSDTGYSV